MVIAAVDATVVAVAGTAIAIAALTAVLTYTVDVTVVAAAGAPIRVTRSLGKNRPTFESSLNICGAEKYQNMSHQPTLEI